MAAGNFESTNPDGSLGGNLLEWVDARFPATSMWRGTSRNTMPGKNFNFWYFFGSWPAGAGHPDRHRHLSWSCTTSRMPR